MTWLDCFSPHQTAEYKVHPDVATEAGIRANRSWNVPKSGERVLTTADIRGTWTKTST